MRFSKSQKAAFLFAATILLLMLASISCGTLRASIVFETEALLTLCILLYAKRRVKSQDEKIVLINSLTNILTLSGALMFSKDTTNIMALILLVAVARLALLVDD